jgi:pimeloyl-ACP methyl ester carboxylesterase
MDPSWTTKTACIRADLHVEVVQPEATSEPGHLVTVVLCHGFGGSARNFRPQARALGNAVRFVLYDARGHGRSAKPLAEEAYQFSCLVEDLEYVADAYATGKVIVGGLSLGAAVALEYTLRRQDRISGLLLAAYPAVSSEFTVWALEFAEIIDKYGVEVAGERFVWGATSRFDPKSRGLIQQGFREHAPWALAALLRRTLATLGTPEALARQLRQVQVPTRIVVGSEDEGSLGPCETLSRLIPGATLTVLEGAGHVVNLARVTEFNEELGLLIARVST